VSCYAFLRRWLLPSPLPGCPRPRTSLPTQGRLGNLSGRGGLFPYGPRTLAPEVCLWWLRPPSSEIAGRRSSFGPPFATQGSTPGARPPRSTAIDFAENQLSPGSIGFSPLATGPPRLLPQTWVRSSRASYSPFHLPMASSPGFGSSRGHKVRGFPTRVHSASMHALKRAPSEDSLTHYAKGTPELPPEGGSLDCLAACRFRISFTPYLGVSFTFPSRYLSTMDGLMLPMAWRMVPPSSRASGSPCTRCPRGPGSGGVAPRGLSPSLAGSSKTLRRDRTQGPSGTGQAPFRSPRLGSSRLMWVATGYSDDSLRRGVVIPGSFLPGNAWDPSVTDAPPCLSSPETSLGHQTSRHPRQAETFLCPLW